MWLSISRVPVVPLPGDEARDGDRGDPAVAGAGLQHVVLEMVERRVQGALVTGRDARLDLGGSERPQNARVLRNRERQIKARNIFAGLFRGLRELIVVGALLALPLCDGGFAETLVGVWITELLPHRNGLI